MLDVGISGRASMRLHSVQRCVAPSNFLKQRLPHRASQFPACPAALFKQKAFGTNLRAHHVLRACTAFWIWAAVATCWHVDLRAPAGHAAIAWAMPRRSQLMPALGLAACWASPGTSYAAEEDKMMNKELEQAQMSPPSLNSALLEVCRALQLLAQLTRRAKDGASGGKEVQRLVKVLLGKGLQDELVRAAYSANSEDAFEPRVRAIEALEFVVDGAGNREQILQSLQIAQASLLDFIAAMPAPDARRAEEAIERENTGSASEFPWRARAQ
mmetsp:Transcript_68136/g.134495  ORF Transcript_68136/g.134495 Transcript_68136/m.134495 type:complete len:271 (+) Transcript_68136:68-880(+)